MRYFVTRVKFEKNKIAEMVVMPLEYLRGVGGCSRIAEEVSFTMR